MFKAHGRPSIGLLLIRLVVGTYTLSLGIMQASNIEDYINKVKALNFFSENTAFIFGFITPFILIIFGALYIMGFFTPVTSFTLAIISFLKIASRGFFPTEGIPFNKDLLFFVCFVTTLFAGAGLISFDALLDKRKKKIYLPTDTDNKENKVITAEVITESNDIVKTEEPVNP